MKSRTQHSLEGGFSGLIFKRMTDIDVCFAGNRDNGNLIERQLFSRANVKRESRARPTKNRVENLARLRFCRNYAALPFPIRDSPTPFAAQLGWSSRVQIFHGPGAENVLFEA
jgi:hypothetical protein